MFEQTRFMDTEVLPKQLVIYARHNVKNTNSELSQNKEGREPFAQPKPKYR